MFILYLFLFILIPLHGMDVPSVDQNSDSKNIPRPKSRSNTSTPTKILEGYTGEIYAVKFLQNIIVDEKSTIDPELIISLYKKYPFAVDKCIETGLLILKMQKSKNLKKLQEINTLIIKSSLLYN